MTTCNSQEHYQTLLDGKPLDDFNIPEEICSDLLGDTLGDLRETHIALISLLHEATIATGGQFSQFALMGINKTFEMLIDSERNQHALLCADYAIRQELKQAAPRKVLQHPAKDPGPPH